MATGKMHDDELDIGPDLVRRLLGAQFPEWADLPISPVPSAGTDNAIFRLGPAMLVRFPRVGWAAGQVEKEQHWLPRLAPHLPLDVPEPLAKGEPGEGYPWQWSVYTWLDGQNATAAQVEDPVKTAEQLADFVRALQSIDVPGGLDPGEHNSFRGVPLAARDRSTRVAVAELREKGLFDSATAAGALDAWAEALAAPVHAGPPVWLHGDLQAGNLLVRHGELAAVIDFGCLGVGDPACDLAVAWNFLDAEAREAFRSALAVDDSSWLRGMGWALSIGLIALPYYHVTNRALAQVAEQAIAAVLRERRPDGRGATQG